MRIETRSQNLQDLAGAVFVPTMGSLHEGHLALVRQGLGRGLPVVVSIFVNPTQFSANEDFGTYPRSLESDARAATEAGATAIYAPPAEEIYPDGPEAAVAAAAAFPVPEVGRTPRLEDGFRPHFFGGVCLVVSRLFDLVDPSCAIFGEKDWQQLQVIRAMVDQQHRTRPIEIESAPIVRDPDGLAMSSRNAYLSDDQRLMGLGLHRALAAIHDEQDVEAAETRMHEILVQHGVEVDYATVRHADTLGPPVEGFASRALIAGRVPQAEGGVRLIDNAFTKAGT